MDRGNGDGSVRLRDIAAPLREIGQKRAEICEEGAVRLALLLWGLWWGRSTEASLLQELGNRSRVEEVIVEIASSG